MLLRIEDIDLARSRQEYTDAIYEDLAAFDLSWPLPVLCQSTRFDQYAGCLARLKEAGLVYRCFCTRREITAEVAAIGGAPHKGEQPVYPGTCRVMPESRADELERAGTPFAWRFDSRKAAERTGRLTWHDRSAGVVAVDPDLLGDVVLARKDTPTSYHLAVVVDDAHQEIELVTRGTDLLPSTHVHRLLQTSLGLPAPEYWHHPLMTGPDGKRLAKRNGAKPLRELLAGGATKDGLVQAVWHQMTAAGFKIQS